VRAAGMEFRYRGIYYFNLTRTRRTLINQSVNQLNAIMNG